MTKRIYTWNQQGRLEPLQEEAFEKEDELRALVAEHLELLDGEQMRPGGPLRWILIAREQGIAETAGTGPRWAIDRLYTKRPFTGCEQMDGALHGAWRQVVGDDDGRHLRRRRRPGRKPERPAARSCSDRPGPQAARARESRFHQAWQGGADGLRGDVDDAAGRHRPQRRVGEFDWQMLRRACHLNSPTDMALTFVDYLDRANRDAIRFDQLTPDTIKFVEDVESVSSVPCSLIGNRFDYKCVIDRRRW